MPGVGGLSVQLVKQVSARSFLPVAGLRTEPRSSPSESHGEFSSKKSRVTCLGVEDPHTPITVMGQCDSVS